MALADYLKGPEHKARSMQLEGELSQLRQRYSLLQELAKKYGALEVQEVQLQIQEERRTLQAVQQEVLSARQEAATVLAHIKELQAQVLVVEETLLLESFALYLPKFKFNASADYKARLDQTRDQQKVLIKSGDAASGNMNWEVNGKKSEGK